MGTKLPLAFYMRGNSFFIIWNQFGAVWCCAHTHNCCYSNNVKALRQHVSKIQDIYVQFSTNFIWIIYYLAIQFFYFNYYCCLNIVNSFNLLSKKSAKFHFFYINLLEFQFRNVVAKDNIF